MRIINVSLIVALVGAGFAAAQEPAVTDAVGQQAAALEAEIGKFKDTSPEAAAAMIKVVDLYHTDGRPYGLVRIAQQFVAAQPNHERHADVMLKLIDGQEALSRNKDLAVTLRQFLSRYPQSAACPQLEVRLADALLQLDDRLKAGEACRAVWQRQGASPVGRRYGATGVALFSAVNTPPAMLEAAALAEDMLDKLPAGEFGRQVGWHALSEFRRAGQWAKSTTVCNKMVQKGLAADPEYRRQILSFVAENQANLGQHANAAETLAQVRAIRSDPASHFGHVYRLYAAGAKPDALTPIVDDYVRTYPTRPDRFQCVSYLAMSCINNNEKPRGTALLLTLLPEDPLSNGNASIFVRENGTEPAQLADTEQKLLAAIAQAKPGTFYLRYVLAFDLYRDRLKDNAKAKQVIRDLISQSPSDDGHTSGAIDWLLYNSADDAEFGRDVQLVLAARRQYPQIAVLRDAVRNWAQSAKQNKDLKGRAETARQEFAKVADDPVVVAFATNGGAQNHAGEKIREKLLTPPVFDALNEQAARLILQAQSDFYRHYAPADKRKETIRVFNQYAKRFPQDYLVAAGLLDAVTDFGQPAEMKAAAENFLRFEPQSNDPSRWYRLMLAAERNADPNMAQAAWKWIQTAQQKFGGNPTYASWLGDMLLKYQMEAQAVQYWTATMKDHRTHHESRDCAQRLLARLQDGPARIAFITDLLAADTDMHGRYAIWLAEEHLKAKDTANFERVLKEATARQAERPFRSGDFDPTPIGQWVDAIKGNTELADDVRIRLLTVIQALGVEPNATAAQLAVLERLPVPEGGRMARLLETARATKAAGDSWTSFDRLLPYAQAAAGRKDYVAASVLATGMLSNIPNLDEPRRKAARDLFTQALSRTGGVGLTIDDSSPLAPLMQAALYHRLGDERLAFETYSSNRKLFDENRNQLPPDLLLFVCDRRMASGTDADHDYVEETLRGWLVAFSENAQHEDAVKAAMQLQLAKNFFKARRYDVARAEYNTVVNRYASTPQAIEAQFGIGESFLAQKVYDQAEQVFEKLSRHSDLDVVVRAEFLRGVLAFGRGDRDEAREIFRGVLERVPSVELANQALFNLAEVYGAEERYIDQLNLLRTVGHLGRASKRYHVPGTPLAIVVHDSDLGISRGHNRIPVRVVTEPGGDEETIYLVGSGAGKGLFRADLETRLGTATKNDAVLQISGRDIIRCDYPEAFKAEFKNVPLSDVEIRVAADARFEVASSKIEDSDRETLSQQLAREQAAQSEDRRQSQSRPANQIKPGNPIYLRVRDADRDLTAGADQVVVKLTADSGDQIQVSLEETGPHSGVFEGQAKTGDLPAGALASDTSIDRSPLMAIDRDPNSAWMSEPDGATPKWLTIDLKSLLGVSRVKVTTPDAAKHAPIKGEILGSQDGEFWFRLASRPLREPAASLPTEYAAMTQRLYNGHHASFTTWDQVVALAKNTKPVGETPVETLAFKRPENAQDSDKPFAVVWQGSFVQPKSSAVRILVNAASTAVVVDGILEIPVGPGGRSCDLWLDAGTHALAIFAASTQGQQVVDAQIARASLTDAAVAFKALRAADFDLQSDAAKQKTESVVPPPVALPLGEVKLTKKTEAFAVVKQNEVEQITNWQATDDSAEWAVTVPQPGPYDVWLDFSHQGDGGRYEVKLGNGVLPGRVPDTGGWHQFRRQKIGTLLVEQGKETTTLAIKPVEIVNNGLMNVKAVWLEPAVGQSVVISPQSWDFRFPENELRYVRFVAQEYLGEAVAVSNVEVGGTASAEPYIPTKEDVLALAANDTLEIAGGDTITAFYTDEVTLGESAGSRLLTGKLKATYHNAGVAAIGYDFERRPNGQVDNVRKDLKRIDPGERIVVEITDYDEDRTNERDTVPVTILVNDGEPMTVTATETSNYTGIFTKEIDTDSSAESGKLHVEPGDRITLRYGDTHNTFPGHAVPREETVYVVQPTLAEVRVLETRVTPLPDGRKGPPLVTVSRDRVGDEPAGVAFEAPLTVEVIDPDAAKDSRSTVLVSLATTDGATVDVLCRISAKFSDLGTPAGSPDRAALEAGRFLGQVILQLGSRTSPAVVPLTTEMPRDLVGTVVLGEDATDNSGANLVTRVLNLSGQDIVTAGYEDQRTPEGVATRLTSAGRLISNGQLSITDREYDKPLSSLHVGERIYLRVVDADRDTSDARDFVEVMIETELGEKEAVPLEETLAHSGVFTGSLQLRAVDAPTPGNLDQADPVLETYFGDTIRASFVDSTASVEGGTLEQTVEVSVVVGTDGLVAAFSKTFQDESLAVETKFRIAESYFELFKSHKDLGRQEEKRIDLENGRRILTEVMEDYPDPKYAPRIAYLLGQFAQELSEWDDAIRSYDLILRQYGDHALAPDAQYKLAQCYEQAGNFDEALEAYVTLAATHPKSPLIPNVMIRISDYFFKKEMFEIAAQVGQKFIERFESHPNAPRMAFRVGQCYFKAKQYGAAGAAFDAFTAQFAKDGLAGDAFFWAGESYRMGGNARQAFISYNNCRWKYPDSEAAKYARGRLALPEMLQQFEAEAKSVDEDR
jgi:TolA-binding protein